MCHAEARAQDARRRACRHRLKMVGPSKASPTQRHNDRGQTEPPHAITPPSRDPPRGRQIADRGGSPSFLRHPRSPNRHAHSTRHAQVLWVEMGDARRQPAPNTSTVNRRHRQARSPTRRSTAAHPRASTSHRRTTATKSQPTSHRPGLPAFCWPPVRQARRRTERHARPDRPRTSHHRRMARTAPLRPDLGQHPDTEPRGWPSCDCYKS